MQKLFENWRKYITEVDTDNDGIDDERELAIIDKGVLEPEEDEASATKGSLYLSEKAKSTIHSYLKGWLEEQGINTGFETLTHPSVGEKLARDLRKGLSGEYKSTSQSPPITDFHHMLTVHIEPEDREAVTDFLGMLIDKIEQNSFSTRFKTLSNELDGLFYVWWLQNQAASDTT